MHTPNITWQERFDERFGKDGPDKNSDSIGRGAGCDDCYGNIKLRAEHKEFLAQELQQARREQEEETLREIYKYADSSIELYDGVPVAVIRMFAKTKGISLNPH